MNKFGILLLLVCLELFFVQTSQATHIDLYSTGVTDSGDLLPYGVPDPHYEVIKYADQDVSPYNVVVPIIQDANWITSSTKSRWIAPSLIQNGSVDTPPPGTYGYRTTFTTKNIHGLEISGLWSSDNFGIILLNGVETGISMPLVLKNFSYFFPFTIDHGFIVGLNTIDFIINNGAGTSGDPPYKNPTGLIVEFEQKISKPPHSNPVPEPSTLLLFIGGLGGLACFRRKTQSKK